MHHRHRLGPRLLASLLAASLVGIAAAAVDSGRTAIEMAAERGPGTSAPAPAKEPCKCSEKPAAPAPAAPGATPTPPRPRLRLQIYARADAAQTIARA